MIANTINKISDFSSQYFVHKWKHDGVSLCLLDFKALKTQIKPDSAQENPCDGRRPCPGLLWLLPQCVLPAGRLRRAVWWAQRQTEGRLKCPPFNQAIFHVELHHLSSHLVLSTWVRLRVISTERRPQQTPGPSWSMAAAGAWFCGVGRAWTWPNMVLLGSTVLLSFAGMWPECRWQPRLHRWHGPSRRAACGAGAGPRAPAPNEKRCLKEPCTALKGVLKIDNSTYCMGSILITAHVEIFFFFFWLFSMEKKKKASDH